MKILTTCVLIYMAVASFCTHVVSFFIANSSFIQQEVTEPHDQNHCHFMRFCRKFILLHY